MKNCKNLRVDTKRENPQLPKFIKSENPQLPKSTKSEINTLGRYHLMQYQQQAHNLCKATGENSKNGMDLKRYNRAGCSNRKIIHKKGLTEVSISSVNSSKPKINLSHLGASTVRESIGKSEAVAARIPSSTALQPVALNLHCSGSKNSSQVPCKKLKEYIKYTNKVTQKSARVFQHPTSGKHIASNSRQFSNIRLCSKPGNLTKREDDSVDKTKKNNFLIAINFEIAKACANSEKLFSFRFIQQNLFTCFG
eukprot:TRINITY_DN58820_c0_g1_i1.p1 TRINITY_DN58820_c0_g1~~TRINITY_DN58820_c0_g1_i1.p1  ORF type:complete len:252 (-),score=16.47 TRINITY_DN58820_c0_g1_i1:185-940(-)